MNRVTWFLIRIPFLTLLIAGCEGAQDVRQPEPVADSSNEVTTAVQDLAGRLGVTPGEIVLKQEQAVTWRNGSLGCPKKGMMYTQALVEGTLIVLEVDGKDYAYHSGKGRPPFYCEHPEKPLDSVKSRAD